MWRVLKFTIFAGLAALAAMIGSAVMTRVAPAGTDNLVTGVAAAVSGMLFGVFYAWTRGIPWHRLAAVVRVWQMHLAGQVWWAAASCISVAVLVFY